jgi:flagellar protein FlaJ
MKFKIPFTFSSLDRNNKQAKAFRKFVRPKKKSKIQDYLNQTETKLTREEYLGICVKNFVFSFLFMLVITTTILGVSKIKNFVLIGLMVSILFSTFIYLTQRNYPKLYAIRKEKNIEKNLIPALEDMLVQLNSGIPLFNIMVNISSSDYSSLSEEFKKIVREINTGRSQVEVLEKTGEKNTSIFFRRTLWQISNGMKSGSDLTVVIKDSIRALNEEQLIQIQDYGNKLNPMIMFYMLIAVILPALSITFITIISSLINLSNFFSIMLYISLFVFVTIIQFMFLGIIRPLRPSLL